MAFEVRFRQRAIEDIDRIWQHIAQDSENYATAVATSIVTAAEELSEYPRVGHRVEHVVRAEVRELAVYPYRLFYASSRKRFGSWRSHTGHAISSNPSSTG